MNKLLLLLSLLIVFSCSINSKNSPTNDPLQALTEEAFQYRKKGYIVAIGICVEKITRKDRVIECAKMNAYSKISESLKVYVEHTFKNQYMAIGNKITEEQKKQILLLSENCLKQTECPSMDFYQTPENIQDSNLTCGVLAIMPRVDFDKEMKNILSWE
jgi:hypothetical protein